MSEERWSVPPRNQTADFDVLMNALGAFIVLFALAIAVGRSQTKKEAKGYVEGVYRVTATWPGQLNDDVDLYVQDPTQQIVYFKSREAGFMHLERDDVGASSDTVLTSAGYATLLKNEEHVILRGTIPGEYIANVHMYHQNSGSEPVPVTLTLSRSADGTVIITRQVMLARTGDEKTAFRFSVDGSGVVTATNELEKYFVGPLAP